jgi:hypothetical protein
MSFKKTEGKYVCEPCDFKTCDLKDFKRHLETRKHNDNAMITKKPNEHICECGHEYKYASGLSRHRKVCSSVTTLVVVPPKANSGAGADPIDYELYDIDVDIDIDSDNDSISTASSGSSLSIDTDDPECDSSMKNKNKRRTGTRKRQPKKTAKDSLARATALDALLTSRSRTNVAQELREANEATNSIDKASRLELLVEKLLLETKDLREMVVKQTELSMEREAKILELASRPTSVVNKFSIVNYLNNDCKEAMSLNDFVDSLQVTMDDMYYTRDNGYVKGVCNVFARSIENLKQTERPIHCTDKKRLKFFIKENDKWVRDDDNKKINKVMNNITEKHIAQLHKWKEAHPNWITEETLRDEFILLTSRILERDSQNGEKVVRNVIKNLGDYTEVKI